MAVGRLDSRNSIQVIPTIPITGRVVLQPNVWYTCPAGKKAVVKGTCVCTGLGAAASVRLNAAGVRICEWDGTGGSDKVKTINNYFDFEVQLAAGETLDTSQDSGTNGETNMFAKVQESPA